jgi:hypothetical protein
MPVTRHLLITLLQIQECVRRFGSHICGYASGPRSAVGSGRRWSSSDREQPEEKGNSFLLGYLDFGFIRILKYVNTFAYHKGLRIARRSCGVDDMALRRCLFRPGGAELNAEIGRRLSQR